MTEDTRMSFMMHFLLAARRRFPILSCVVALALMRLALPAAAQSRDSTGFLVPGPGHRDTVYVAPPAFSDTTRPVLFLREMVVTGSRYPRAYYESPQALSFVPRARLLEQEPTVLGDVLSTLPGVDNSKDSPWEQRPVLRGMGGQRVLVLVDGAPINSARGNGPHPSLVDPSEVERVEVVRGPTSVAYGSDALGGAINIITREAGLPQGPALRGSATLGASTVDHGREAHGELMPHVGKLSAYLAGGGRQVKDFKVPNSDGFDVTVPKSGFEDWNAMGNLRYPLTEQLTLRAGGQVYRGTDIGLPGLHTEFPGFLQDFSFPFYKRDAARLSLERNDTQGFLESSHLTGYWQRERRNFNSHEELDTTYYVPPPGVPSNAIQYTDQDRLLDIQTFGVRAQATSRRTETYMMSAGVDFAQDRTDGDNTRHRYWNDAYGTRVLTGADRVTASIPDGTFANYAGFTTWEWYAGPQWTVHAGGRYTHYRYRTEYGLKSSGPPATYFQALSLDDDALSGTLGVVYALRPTMHLSANVANGYREPNAQDLFFEGPASVGTVLGNPALKPERSVSYDVGLRWGPHTFAVSGNAFIATFDDLIEAIQIAAAAFPGAPATYQYVNISSARTMGVELEGEARFLDHYETRLMLAATMGDITSAEAIYTLYGVNQSRAPLPNVPPFKGSASVRWHDTKNRFWVEPSARWSWRTNRLPLTTPGVPQSSNFTKEWLVGDVMVGVRLPRGQKVLAGVHNVGDTSYQQPLASIEEPGRSYLARLTVEF
jgi:hemoglobin/transferrin/lactoferrin receptor protein